MFFVVLVQIQVRPALNNSHLSLSTSLTQEQSDQRDICSGIGERMKDDGEKEKTREAVFGTAMEIIIKLVASL